MKINFQYKIAMLFVLLSSQMLFAQKQDGQIGTEVVNVVKTYTPTISDAFKVKETPSLEDEDNSKKETIQYTIFSFPVASTFTPSKGKAAGVENGAKEKLFNNYATFAAGNYGSINADLFVTQTLESGDYVGAMFRHLSSQGGIKNVDLNNKFSNSSLDKKGSISSYGLFVNVPSSFLIAFNLGYRPWTQQNTSIITASLQ
jgi:hypothetical protein